MTREERAIRSLCKTVGTYEEVMNSPIANQLLFPVGDIVAAMLAFADAEAAAMRERAAVECEEQAKMFLSPKYATGQPLSSMMERFACGQCAESIRALPVTGEE